jgi:RNA polymerase sigma factor (TIGR02999 family)
MAPSFFLTMGTESGQSAEITRLLKAWNAGDNAALDALIPRIYKELHRLARRCMRKERAGATLQTTALVNEVYLRLVEAQDVDWNDRAHFFAIGAQLMRRILVEAARARSSAKRGGPGRRVQCGTTDLDQVADVLCSRDRELVAIDEALDALAKVYPRKAQVIELRFFGGLTVEDTAEVLKISPQSVMRDWKLAKAWLTRELKRGTSKTDSDN